MEFGVTLTRFVQPEVLATHFHFREGDRVGDLGAGTGHFLRTLSRIVGDEGQVYALDVQKDLVAALREHIKEHGLQNVEPFWGNLEDIGGIPLQEGTLDGAVFINTLFQLENRESALKEAARALRRGGKLFVVDWHDSFHGIGPSLEHVITEAAARELVGGAGFSYERNFPAGEHHYGLGFRKI